MKRMLFIKTAPLVLLIVTFFSTDLYAANFDLSGTWNYTLSNNWAVGDIGCAAGPDTTGTCVIVQTADIFSFAYLSGVVCDPAESCTFEGSVDGSVYMGSTTDIVDDENGTVTSVITFTASSTSSAAGSGTSTYTHPSGEWNCNWGSNITLYRSEEEAGLEQYRLTVTTEGSGTVELLPAGGIYSEGTQVQLTAVPDASSVFSSWSGDLSGSENPAAITMDSNKSVKATFNNASEEESSNDSGGGGGGGGGCYINIIR